VVFHELVQVIPFPVIFSSGQPYEILGQIDIVAVVAVKKAFEFPVIHMLLNEILPDPTDLHLRCKLPDLPAERGKGLFLIPRANRLKTEGGFVPGLKENQQAAFLLKPYGQVLMTPHEKVGKSEFGNMGLAMLKMAANQLSVLDFNRLMVKEVCHDISRNGCFTGLSIPSTQSSMRSEVN
jgi:hypothetical protein